MTSFRHYLQRVSLGLIAVLLTAFCTLLYIGLSVILYAHVDNDLQHLAQAEAQEIERSTGELAVRTREERHENETRKRREGHSEEHEYEAHELQEAIRSSIVLAPDGAVLWTGENAGHQGGISPQSLQQARDGHTVFETIVFPNDSPIRRIYLPVEVDGQVSYILQSNASLRFVEKTLHWLAWVLAGVSGIVLLLAWIGSTWLARQALSPIEQLSQTATNISGTTLDTRLVMTAPYVEFHHLAVAFNNMLDRLQKTLDAQRRFVADAAHELKTPLTAMKGHLEITLNKPRTTDEYREAIMAALGDTDRLHHLTKSLLTLAQLSGDNQSTLQEPVQVQSMVEEVRNELQVLAEDKGITLKVDATPVPEILGDTLQLRRMIVNLLDNALRHTPRGGSVTVRVIQETDNLLISVSDTGSGISPQHLPHVFDRFYRVDSARDRQSGGTGLGLALVKEIAEHRGGQVSVHSEVGKGTTFRIVLPITLSC